MDWAWIIIISTFVLYFLIMIPVQYANIGAVKEELKKSKKTHNEVYDEMGFEEQQMQFNLQGNPMNIPSTLIAALIYRVKHGRDK